MVKKIVGALKINSEGERGAFSDVVTAYIIFALLISIYSLTYSGRFITDDEHLLASRTLSLAFDKSLGDTRVYGNSRLYALTNISQPYAAQAANIEPGQMVIGSLFARMASWLGIGKVQSLFLVNIWATAFTSVTLFIIVRQMGYPQRTAIWTAMLFGVGSIAWPYSRTYFRDTLAMMFLAISWAFAVMITKNIGGKKSKSYLWLLMLVSLIAGVLSKNTIVIALPVLLIYITFSRWRQGSSTFSIRLLKNKKTIILAVAGTLLIILWLAFLSPTGLFARYSLEYYQLLFQKFFLSPHPHILEALLGPLLSPGKSIFLFTPILIIALISLFKRTETAWPGWAYLGFLILAQALFYDEAWWGFINWGLRFTLPAIPLLMISAAPIVDIWLSTPKGLFALWGLATISVVVQLMGILPPLGEYYQFLYSSTPPIADYAAVWEPQYSAILWGARWIFDGGDWSLAIMQGGGLVIGGFGILILLVGIVWRFTRIPVARLAATALGISLLMSILMLFLYKDDPYYYPFREDIAASHEKISAGMMPKDLVIIKSYGTPVWYYWMNWADSYIPWTSLPYHFPSPDAMENYAASLNPEAALDEITLSLLKSIPGNYRCVWLLIAGDSPGASLNIEVKWLKQESMSHTYWEFKYNNIETRLFLFDLTSESCG